MLLRPAVRSYDRLAFQKKVLADQSHMRVASKSEKVQIIAIDSFTTLGAAGLLAGLSVLSFGVATFPVIAGLAIVNGVAGGAAVYRTVNAFKHKRPPAPASLRKHSFYNTGVTATQSEAVSIKCWLKDQKIVARGRNRLVLSAPTVHGLINQGIRQRFPTLNDQQIMQIADTLQVVKELATPHVPQLGL